MERLISAIRRYTAFSGRAAQAEGMIIYLLTMLVYAASALFLGPECRVPLPQWPGHYIVLLGGAGWVSALLTVIVTVPAIAVAVRRLHDQGRSGWWLLILPLLLPWLGHFAFIASIGVFAGPGVAGPNRYGPDPREQSESAAA